VDAWHQTKILTAHKLTVTQIEFSHDDNMILAASRDRSISLWRKTSADDLEYQLVAHPIAHDRIVWSVSFSPDDRFFATASRDKSVKIWQIGESEVTCVCHQTIRIF